MNKLYDLLVIGTGGLTMQCLPLIMEKYKTPAFYNDKNNEENIYYDRFPIHHSDEFIKVSENFIVCVSNPKDRFNLINKFRKRGAKLTNLVSKQFPNQIGDWESGLIVLDGCLIEPNVQISSNCLINTKCSVHHGSKLGEFVTLSPNVVILGDCEIGDYSFIGAGAIIKEKTKIGKNSIIGMGSVVLNDVPDNEVWFGNPAKFVKKNN